MLHPFTGFFKKYMNPSPMPQMHSIITPSYIARPLGTNLRHLNFGETQDLNKFGWDKERKNVCSKPCDKYSEHKKNGYDGDDKKIEDDEYVCPTHPKNVLKSCEKTKDLYFIDLSYMSPYNYNPNDRIKCKKMLEKNGITNVKKARKWQNNNPYYNLYQPHTKGAQIRNCIAKVYDKNYDPLQAHHALNKIVEMSQNSWFPFLKNSIQPAIYPMMIGGKNTDSYVKNNIITPDNIIQITNRYKQITGESYQQIIDKPHKLKHYMSYKLQKLLHN